MRLYWDTEAKGLLNSSTVDYTCSPYKIMENYMHCAVFIDVDTNIEYTFVGDEIKNVKDFLLKNCTELIGHNTINYDHMAMLAAYGLEFDIGVFEGKAGNTYSLRRDSLCGKPITITDTLVLSKTLNPDRPLHGLAYFGKILGLEKIDWRAKAIELGLIESNAEKGAEFLVYHPDMLIYCIRDCHVGIKAWKYLMSEWGKWKWDNAYQLEKAVALVITHQEHRGFAFNSKLAVSMVKDLDEKLEALKNIVEPLIPQKPIGLTAAKAYIPSKKQFKLDGSVSGTMEKWVEKHGGTIVENSGIYTTKLYGEEYTLPIPQKSIITHVPATIKDSAHIKGWLVELGWMPTMYKDRDITVDSKKKKLSLEKYVLAVEKYIAQTMESPFKSDRLEHLEVSSEALLRNKLLKHDYMKRPMKVLTNPSLTVGTEKEIDPALLAMSHKFNHAQDVSHYYTYKHRRSSILGGNVDPEDDDEEMHKGWMSVDRLAIDGRIPTPADTCGASTSRFKHRLVANIPRVTSLYGDKMRSLFGVSAGYFLLGYDFDGLEARIESHYCWRYDDENHTYCKSLTGEKPNDVHTLTAKKISIAIQEAFGRSPAKSVKYAVTYGARAARVAKIIGRPLAVGEVIFSAFWEAAQPLAFLQDKLKIYWEDTGGMKFILGIDGRKIPTRSASALLNSLFQSAGVICAKRAMIIHDRKLKGAGLFVNFWTEDWKNKVFAQQLIAYHDEANLEVDKSLVKWKLFPVKDKNDEDENKKVQEEAKEWKANTEAKEGSIWSDVGHSDKGYYVGYCKVGELAVEAVNESGEYYNLNVPLTAGYMLGTSWATTH